MGWQEIFEAKKANVTAWHGGHQNEKPKGFRHEKPSPTWQIVSAPHFPENRTGIGRAGSSACQQTQKKPHLCAAFLE